MFISVTLRFKSTWSVRLLYAAPRGRAVGTRRHCRTQARVLCEMLTLLSPSSLEKECIRNVLYMDAMSMLVIQYLSVSCHSLFILQCRPLKRAARKA